MPVLLGMRAAEESNFLPQEQKESEGTVTQSWPATEVSLSYWHSVVLGPRGGTPL